MERKILVVEDDLTLKPILTSMIAKLHARCSVDWVTNVDDAVQLILKEAQNGSKSSAYDVILSDITLEGSASGFDLLDACRRAKVKSKFFLTSSRPAGATKVLVSSASGYLQKPVTLADLKAIWRELGFAGPPRPDNPILESIYITFLGWILLILCFLTFQPTGNLPVLGQAAGHRQSFEP